MREAELAQRGHQEVAPRLESASRRSSRMASVSGVKQASAARCDGVGGEMYRFCASFSRSRTWRSGATIQPSRQPVMLKYFEKLEMTNSVVGELERAARRAPS